MNDQSRPNVQDSCSCDSDFNLPPLPWKMLQMFLWIWMVAAPEADRQSSNVTGWMKWFTPEGRIILCSVLRIQNLIQSIYIKKPVWPHWHITETAQCWLVLLCSWRTVNMDSRILCSFYRTTDRIFITVWPKGTKPTKQTFRLQRC